MDLLAEQLHKRLGVYSTSYQRQRRPCGQQVCFLPKLEARRECSTKSVRPDLGRLLYIGLAYSRVRESHSNRSGQS